MKLTNPAYTMTGGQCHSKLNGLEKTYKKILDHNNSKSGNDRVTWPYFDRMNEIFGTTGWANPAATASEAGPSSPSDSSTPSSSEPKKRKLDAILEDFFKEKKKNMNEKLVFKKEQMERMLKMKQQQHQEKMEILKSFCNQYKK